jgi:hypothetical protein
MNRPAPISVFSDQRRTKSIAFISFASLFLEIFFFLGHVTAEVNVAKLYQEHFRSRPTSTKPQPFLM